MHLLDLKNVNITYNTNDKKVRAVRNVSLSVDEQESVGIVGESGSGKSTLVMGILRLLPENIVETSGEALLEGKDISNGVIVFINGGQQNDDILQILTESTEIEHCTWVKRLNACDVYYCK